MRISALGHCLPAGGQVLTSHMEESGSQIAFWRRLGQVVRGRERVFKCTLCSGGGNLELIGFQGAKQGLEGDLGVRLGAKIRGTLISGHSTPTAATFPEATYLRCGP